MTEQLPIYQAELSYHYLVNFSCLGFYPTERQFKLVMNKVDQGLSPYEIAQYFINQ